MTQTVKLPNGDTLNFPDEMDDDAITKVISDNYPEFAPKNAAAAPAAPAAKPAPVAAAAPAADSGGLLDAIGGWYDRTKKAIIDTPVLAPGQEPGQPAPADPEDAKKYGVMANAGNRKAGPDFSDIPVTPDYLRAMRAQWNGATPEQRLELAKRPDHMGVVARRMNEAQPGKLPQAPAPDPLGLYANDDRDPVATMRRVNEQYQRTAASDMMDPTAEARARQLVRAGVNGDLANNEARVAAARDIPVGAETSRQSSANVSDFDFATYKKFNEDPFWSNPVVRGAVKGYEGYKQGILGLNQAVGELAGVDTFGQQAMAKDSRDYTEAMGERGGYLQRMFEGSISSIAQQAPALIGGAVTGSEGLVLGSMFASTFGQEYSDTRAKGQDQGAALTRAGLFGAFEVIGEKFGLGERLKLLKDVAHGVDTPVLAKWMANTLREELPGEMLTTTGQFLVDKERNVGMDQDAGWDKYLQQMADTFSQTLIQGAVMSSATGGAHNAHRYMRGDFDRGAEFDANAAQRDALASWNMNGLSPSSRSSASSRAEPTWRDAMAGAAPAARQEPSLGDIAGATSVDEAIAAAAAFTDAPATIPDLPVPPSVHATAADIDALEQQAGMTANHTPDEQQAAHDHLMAEMQARALEAAGKQTAGTPPADLPAGPEAAPAAGSTGKESVDPADWHPFPPESRTLGVPRAQMPQIRAEHRGAMVNFLNARGISHEEVEVQADDLKPTQREFSISKVQKAIEHQGGNRAILISSDNYVLDGHHQWLAAAEKGEPIRAIRLNAPIKQLVKTVHEFPSATVDTSSAGNGLESKAVDSGRPLTPYEQSQERIRRQEEVVRQAIEKQATHRAGQAPQEPGSTVASAPAAPMPSPKPTAGQRMRERIHRENPFLGFLATHGLNIEERSDTGGQKGRAGGVIVPGFGGSLYRKNGARLDELAQLAHEAGFLSDDDINDPTDTGGTRKLADMIERAVHSKEVIQAPGLIEAHVPSTDQQLLEEAHRLGIDHAGMDSDQLYDAVRAALAHEEGRHETSGASSVEEQEQIDHYAEQFDMRDVVDAQLDDSDIPFDLADTRMASSNHLTDEEIDAKFGIQKAAGTREGSGQVETGTAGAAPEGAPRAGQPGQREIRARLKEIARRLGIAVNESKGGFSSGSGMVHIPAEDQEAEGAQSPEHVFAHELGHAIISKRGLNFIGIPMSHLRSKISNWDELVAASKGYRPAVWNHEREKVRKHAAKPNEIIADALGSVLIGEQPLSLLAPMMDSYGINEWDMGLRERGQADGDNLLTSYTASDVLEREDAATARAKAIQAERDKLEARRKAEQDAKENRARADASVDDFQLGQDAHAQLSGQRGMFDEPAPAAHTEKFGDRNNPGARQHNEQVDRETESWGFKPGTFDNNTHSNGLISPHFKVRDDVELPTVNNRLGDAIRLGQGPNGKWGYGLDVYGDVYGPGKKGIHDTLRPDGRTQYDTRQEAIDAALAHIKQEGWGDRAEKLAEASRVGDAKQRPAAPRAPKQADMERQEFPSTAGVGNISAVKERYGDKFGVSWASTHIATGDTMEEAAAIARAVAESGADNIADMRAAAAQAGAEKKFSAVTEGPTAQRLRSEDKHVFGQPRIHTYDPTQARPVVLISCSEPKLEGGPHRAVDLYQGGLFDMLRKWMPENNRPDVYIISAEHGLVHADTLLDHYEQPMTQERLEALMKKGINARDIGDKNFSQVFIAGSAQYRELGQTYAERMRKAGFLAPDAAVLGSAPGAGIGTQRGDLGEYLKQLEAKATPETKQLADELGASQARRAQANARHRTETNERQAADSAHKSAQVKTPGTNLVWSNLAGWLETYRQLDSRAASSKRTVQLREHVGQLANNPEKITSETDSRVLDQAKALLEGLQAGRGQRENDPATKAVQLLGTQLAKVLPQPAWNVGARAMLPTNAKMEGNKEAGFTYGLTGTIESIKNGKATVRVIEPPRDERDATAYPGMMHGRLAVDVSLDQLLPPGVEISDDLKSVARMETEQLDGRIETDVLNDQQGVVVGRPTAINQSLAKGRYQLDDLAGAYGRTRAYLRRIYGPMVTLYRAEPAREKWHPDTQVVYMGDMHLADKFYRDGRKLETYRVPVDDIVGLNVQKNGYYEFIVKRQGEPMARAEDPGQAKARTYIDGDQVEYTGKTEDQSGTTFYEVKFLEGPKAGTTRVTSKAPGSSTNALQHGPAQSAGIVTPQVPTRAEPASAEPAVDTGADIPADFYKGETAQYRALGDGTLTDMPADEALAKTREDIQQLEDMLKCMGD